MMPNQPASQANDPLVRYVAVKGRVISEKLMRVGRFGKLSWLDDEDTAPWLSLEEQQNILRLLEDIDFYEEVGGYGGPSLDETKALLRSRLSEFTDA